MKIKIGTRNSKLALWQAEHVAHLLKQQGVETEIIPIVSKGDKILDRSLAEIGSKGLFTEELEEMLRNQEIDLAVHSAKDVQSELPQDLEIIAFTEREQAHDVVVSLDGNFSLSQPKKVIGTSSVRRKAFLRCYYPQHIIVDVRGNLQTRMKKMEEGHCDALILAYAGVHRMGLSQYISAHLDSNEFIPPVGQGTLAIQIASNLDADKKDKIKSTLNHEDTELCLLAERAFLNTMEGGCSIPAFAHAILTENNMLFMKGGIISTDGKTSSIQMMNVPSTSSADKIGRILAEKVLNTGGQEILDKILQNKTLNTK